MTIPRGSSVCLIKLTSFTWLVIGKGCEGSMGAEFRVDSVTCYMKYTWNESCTN